MGAVLSSPIITSLARPPPRCRPAYLVTTSGGTQVAINPTAAIIFLDGQLDAALNLATNIAIKLGPSTSGPLLRPTLVSQTSSVLQFLQGPLVASAAHHVTYSGSVYVMRTNASTLGSIGSVTKTPATTSPASLGGLAVSLTSYTLHAQIDAITASSLVLTTAALAGGWTAPSAPLQLTVVAGVGAVANTLTITYVDCNGDTQTGTLAISAAGTFTTAFTTGIASIISIVPSAAPIGTLDFTAAFTTPADRYYVRTRTITGGVLGVSGGTTPKIQVSLDDGLTYSRTLTLASTGILELTTYAGGLTPQATGMTLTYSPATTSQEVYGSLRVTGATVPGDVVYTKKVSAAVTVTHVVAGVSTAFSVGVVGNAITVNSATDGGGLATTTANDIVAGILASTAASALVSVVAVGAGTGLMAAHASAGFANSNVDYTPKQEGVQVKHGNPGVSNTSIIVATVGKLVTIYPVTDADGVQTSTATQLVAAVTGDATASLLLAAAVTGTGAGIVGMQNVYTVLPVSLATGDVFSFSTTPPSWNAVDLAEALETLRTNDTALDAFSVMHVLGSAVDNDVQSVQDWLDNLGNTKRKFKAAYLESTYMGATSESTWVAALLSGYTPIDTDPKVGLCAGEVNTLNPANATIDRRNVSTAYMARLMICSISELPSHVNCETDLGIQNAVSGVQVRKQTGASVPPLWQTDDGLIQLNTANFVTFRTLPGRTGIYVRQGLMFTIDGSDYTFVTNRRTADVVAAVAYNQIIQNLNANLLVDPATGQLAEVEIKRIESQVEGAIRDQVMGGARQHISGVRVVIDRGTNFQATGEITGEVRIVGRTPATSIILSLGYVRTIGATV